MKHQLELFEVRYHDPALRSSGIGFRREQVVATTILEALQLFINSSIGKEYTVYSIQHEGKVLS